MFRVSKLENYCTGSIRKFGLYDNIIKGVASYEATEAFVSAEILTLKKNSKGYLEKGEYSQNVTQAQSTKRFTY